MTKKELPDDVPKAAPIAEDPVLVRLGMKRESVVRQLGDQKPRGAVPSHQKKKEPAKNKPEPNPLAELKDVPL